MTVSPGTCNDCGRDDRRMARRDLCSACYQRRWKNGTLPPAPRIEHAPASAETASARAPTTPTAPGSATSSTAAAASPAPTPTRPPWPSCATLAQTFVRHAPDRATPFLAATSRARRVA